MLLAAYTLWSREIVRFYRQRSRIVGALGTPLIFWVLIGSGLGQSFQAAPGVPLQGGYLEYFFPGTLALILLFTAIFSTISIIEDRQEGFLQGVMVAPVPRMAIVLGKILGGTTLAVMQGVIFLALAPLAHVHLRDFGDLAYLVVFVSFGLTGLGFLMAWLFDSTQGFHAIMNLVLFPMWILSGALFPAAGAAGWVRAIMLVNPLTYGVTALQELLLNQATAWPSLDVCLAVVGGFAILTLVAGAILVAKKAN
ncbi:MAG: ABC transporter permease [Acidobacteriota bacterium]|nr:ABC transporter permease [Acidobacteriota bacterium]